jgi:hypothetical protein
MLSEPQADPPLVERWLAQHPSVFLGLARIAFSAAFLFTCWSAFRPAAEEINLLLPWDKALHFIGFYGLTGLAAAAFPRRNLLLLAAGLCAFGVLIEVVQSTPFVNRDPEFWDWVADSAGILCALLPLLLVPWRDRLMEGR